MVHRLSVFDKHQIRIAKSTLLMTDAGARVMGGMTKPYARRILKKFGVCKKYGFNEYTGKCRRRPRRRR